VEVRPEASFLKERSRLCGKLTPMQQAHACAMVAFGSVGAYARVGAYAKVGAYGSFKKLPSGANPTKHDFPNFTHNCKIFSQICIKTVTNL
jgi:hypothetical protein